MKLPITCPSCDHALKVSALQCPECQTRVNGSYDLPLILRLSAEEQKFILLFFISSGSIKEMAAQEGVSYPTMRNRLDDLINKVKQLDNEETN